MGRIRRAFDEAAIMRSERGHLSLLPLATLVSPLLCQLKFNGGVSSSSNSNSPSANSNTNRPTNVDEKFFFGGDTPSLTGNQNGNTHGACRSTDNTGQTWCYTTGWNNNCGDLQTSKRYQNNPWSYRACSNQG